MATPVHPLPWAPAIYLEIGLCVDLWTLLDLLCVSSQFNLLLRHYLYRHIGVERSPGKLIDSLAKNSDLPPIVQSLSFEKPGSICMEQWERVFPQLINLDYFTIAGGIPLPRRLLRLSTCRLTYFAAGCTVIRSWVDFIATQPDIDELRFDRDFLGPVPKPELLPKLCAIKARPNDWVKFAELYKLFHIWSYTGARLATDNLTFASLQRLSHSPSRLATLRISCDDFLAIIGYAPRLLTRLRHLVLDEDLTWTEFTLGDDAIGLEDSSWARVAASLNSRFIDLQGIFLVCGQTRGPARRRRLRRSDGDSFARILFANCKAPALKAFRFYTYDGYAIWTGLGTAAPKRELLDFPTDYWMENLADLYVNCPMRTPCQAGPQLASVMPRRSLLPLPKRVVDFDINKIDRRPRERPKPPTPEPEARLEPKHKIVADPEVEARWLAFAQEHFETGEQPGEIWGGKTENAVDTRSDAEKKHEEEIADWEERQIAWLFEEGVKEMKEKHPFVYREWLQERSLEERREREIALRQAQDQASRGDYSGTKYVDVD